MIAQKEMPTVSLLAYLAEKLEDQEPRDLGVALGPDPDMRGDPGGLLSFRPPWATAQGLWFSVGRFLLLGGPRPSCGLPPLASTATSTRLFPWWQPLGLCLLSSLCDFSITGH